MYRKALDDFSFLIQCEIVMDSSACCFCSLVTDVLCLFLSVTVWQSFLAVNRKDVPTKKAKLGSRPMFCAGKQRNGWVFEDVKLKIVIGYCLTVRKYSQLCIGDYRFCRGAGFSMKLDFGCLTMLHGIRLA